MSLIKILGILVVWTVCVC